MTTTSRGYGRQHQLERARWKPIVESGGGQCHAVVCLMPTRYIAPNEPWDLGHTPDRRRWTGPEHAKCNRTEGANRRNGKVTQKKPRSRDW